jgi:formylglycine-generating enzyme required for sulfatase activity
MFVLVLGAIALVVGLVRKNQGQRGIDSPQALGRAVFGMYQVFAWLFLAAGIVDICAAAYKGDVDESMRKHYAGSTLGQPKPPPVASASPGDRNSQNGGDLAYRRYVEEVTADAGSTEWGKLVRQILEHPEYEVEALNEAGQALGMLGPGAEAAVPVLVGMLDYERNKARCSEGVGPESMVSLVNMARCNLGQLGAIRALGRIGPLAEPSVPRLITILHGTGVASSSSSAWRIRAACALGQIGPAAKDAIPSLVDIAAHDEDPFLRDTAASALEAIRLPAASATARGAVRPVVRSNYVLYMLTQRLTGSDFEKRYEAIRAIGALGPSARLAVANLIAVTTDDNPSLRAKAAWALGQVGPDAKEAIAALSNLASKDPNSAVREAAQAALLEIGQPELTLDMGGGVTMKMVLIRPGKFRMGDEGEGRHEVTISKPFYMGVTEVTQAQYVAVMGTNPSKFKGATNPVEAVSWNDATEFCKKLSEKTRQVVRLPTEAEWEYACRAGTQTAFSFGDDPAALGDYAKWAGNSGMRAHPVGWKKPNSWGLYDMHGNVLEWCADWYGEYPKGPVTDPSGPATGNGYRVVRGGSWFNDDSVSFRCAFRNFLAPTYRLNKHGFRCAKTLP